MLGRVVFVAAGVAILLHWTLIGLRAYVYLYPLVLMDATRESTLFENGVGHNVFTHIRSFPDASNRSVVNPNLDTLYSSAMLDLDQGPLVLTLPVADRADRYYVYQFMDLWSNTPFSLSPRNELLASGDFLLCGPKWNGMRPASIPEEHEIRLTTRFSWLLGRIAVQGEGDLAAVHAFQDRTSLLTLTAWSADDRAPPTESPLTAADLFYPKAAMPPQAVSSLSTKAFFQRAASLMAENPAPSQDAEMLAQLKRLGITKDALPSYFLPVLALAKASAPLAAKISSFIVSSNDFGWRGLDSAIGEYGTNYWNRMVVADIGLGANLVEDALYRVHWRLDGARRGRLLLKSPPPVKAFWSITLYEDGYISPYGGYISSLQHLHTKPDGSIEIELQQDQPSSPEANWIQVPPGSYTLTARFYWPESAVINGTWTLPPIEFS